MDLYESGRSLSLSLSLSLYLTPPLPAPLNTHPTPNPNNIVGCLAMYVAMCRYSTLYYIIPDFIRGDSYFFIFEFLDYFWRVLKLFLTYIIISKHKSCISRSYVHETHIASFVRARNKPRATDRPAAADRRRYHLWRVRQARRLLSHHMFIIKPDTGRFRYLCGFAHSISTNAQNPPLKLILWGTSVFLLQTAY